jgi:hypothetical protein
MYIHPDYMDPSRRPQFRKTFDIYGLGIVLIELACWKKIDEVLQLPSEPELVDDQTVAGADEEGDDDDFKNDTPASPTDSKPKPSIKAIRNIRPQILDPKSGVLDQVEAAMGGKYRDAVYACVKGMEAFGLGEDKDQANPLIGTLLQQAFITQVVDPLMSIQV